jgi:hypothetical protein
MSSYTDDELFSAATILANAYPDELTQESGPQMISGPVPNQNRTI